MIRILIVEDEDIIIKVMKKTFSLYGECEVSKTGDDAMMQYMSGIENDKPFDLVLLDISLGEGSGLSVLKEIRDMEKKAGIKKHSDGVKIVMTTGNRKEKVVKDSIAAGCNGYILKPLVPEMVAKTMENFKFEPMVSPEA